MGVQQQRVNFVNCEMVIALIKKGKMSHRPSTNIVEAEMTMQNISGKEIASSMVLNIFKVKNGKSFLIVSFRFTFDMNVRFKILKCPETKSKWWKQENSLNGHELYSRVLYLQLVAPIYK